MDNPSKENYFSIIIPAHNEGRYIQRTLNKLSTLNYPFRKYEIIVIENGSLDDTYKIITYYKNKIKNLKIFRSSLGVSKARNYGLSKVKKGSDYCIFLDADTILEKDFLEELNHYLNKKKYNNYVIGTTFISPMDAKGFYSRLWFKFYNFGHKLTDTSYSIQIVKTSIAKKIKYDEALNFSEDLKFIREAKKFGRFFFFETKKVLTSDRRFKKGGYFATFLEWNLQLILPRKVKKRSKYIVIR